MIPHDKIAILEFMNADWAKGRSDRTGQEGIFPRSYVNIIEEKAANGGLGTGEKANGLGMAPPPGSGNNYGNMPLDVSQGGSNKEPSKANEQGKKFGKKLGNAGELTSISFCCIFGQHDHGLGMLGYANGLPQLSSAPAPQSVQISLIASSKSRSANERMM